MATAINLNIVQGSDFSISIIASDDLGQVIDLTNHTVGGYVKRRYGDASPFFDLGPTIGSDPKTGEININLLPSQTETLPVGQYVYGIECVTGSSVAFKVMNGIINVIPEVNR